MDTTVLVNGFRQEISTIPSDQKIEVEARLGYNLSVKTSNNKSKSFFQSRPHEFVRLFSHVKSLFPYETFNYQVISYNSKELTERRTLRQIRSGKDVTWQTKSKKRFTSTEDRWIRFSVGIEIDIPSSDLELAKYKQDSIRDIQRTRFRIGDLYFLDMSVVEINDPKYKLYEVELEMVNPRDVDALPSFIETAAKLVSIMKDTPVVYTLFQISSLNQKVNSLFRQRSMMNYIDQLIFTQPQNLEITDITHGHLFDIIKPDVKNPIFYGITQKTDGQRRILIVDDKLVWLVWAPYVYQLLGSCEEEETTILDGELIPPESRRNTDLSPNKLWFEVFDVLMVRSKDVRHYNYGRRVKEFFDVPDFKLNLIHVTPKNVGTYRTQGEFKAIVQKLIDDDHLRTLPYGTDGIILIPLNYGYIPAYDFRSGETRPDVNVLKWKPVDKLSIDFRVRINEQRLYELLYVNPGGEEVPFTGTKGKPFDSSMIDQKYKSYLLQPGNIVEFYPVVVDEEIILRPERLRDEKSAPNSSDAVFSTWSLIFNNFNPLDISEIDLQLMKSYHRRISRSLFAYPLKKNSLVKQQILLDLGGGRGGDANQWMNYHFVITVEPNPENIAEMVRRLTKKRMTDRVYILKCGAENSAEIARVVYEITNGQGVDAIAMIDSLTFFWKDIQLLGQLSTTIRACLKNGGYFIWKSLNGNSVREYLIPSTRYAGPLSSEYEISYGEVVMQFKLISDNNGNFALDRKALVSIPGIVNKNQVEYLTCLTDLRQLLETFDYNCFTADKEEHLQGKMLDISSLYSYGSWKNRGDLRILDVSQVNVLPNMMQVSVPEVITRPVSSSEFIPAYSKKTPIMKEARIKILQRTDPLENLIGRSGVLMVPTSVEVCDTSRYYTGPNYPVPRFPSFRDEMEKRANPRTIEMIGSSIPPNQKKLIECFWYSESDIVRLGNPEQGPNSLLHAILQSYFEKYQNTENLAERQYYTAQFRIGLSNFLMAENKLMDDYLISSDANISGERSYTNWEVNSRYLPIYVEQVLETVRGTAYQKVSTVDHSAVGLYNYFRSNTYFDEEHLELVAAFLGINIAIVIAETVTWINDGNQQETIRPDRIYESGKKDNPTIVLAKLANNFWEVIGRYSGGLTQTLFVDPLRDSFILGLRRRVTLLPEIPNPSVTFLQSFILLTERVDAEVHIVPLVYELMTQGITSNGIDTNFNPFYARLWVLEKLADKIFAKSYENLKYFPEAYHRKDTLDLVRSQIQSRDIILAKNVKFISRMIVGERKDLWEATYENIYRELSSEI